jgi:hypothetical protein
LAAESDVKANQERTMDSQSLLADDVAHTKDIMQLAHANVVMLKKAITLKKEALHEQPVCFVDWIGAQSWFVFV